MTAYDGSVTSANDRQLSIVYFGNHGVRHSTESHVARALENNGHVVRRIQENDIEAWRTAADWTTWDFDADTGRPDFVLWTRTGWDWTRHGSTKVEADGLQRRMLALARRSHIPVIGYHLDIWWGLAREHQVFEEPFFEVDLLVTADGGHDADWERANVNHFWFPPAVSRDECAPGMFRDEFFSQVAFVGSWQDYHPEHPHRAELVQFLRHNYNNVTKFWPERGRPAVRNEDLRDLYASSLVNVGDSCFAGRVDRYISDRCPETLGRGGLLIHPRVAGVTDGSDWEYAPTWAEDDHLLCWEADDWDELGEKIDWALDHPDTCKEIAAAGRAFTLEHHTYERRTSQLIEHLSKVGLL